MTSSKLSVLMVTTHVDLIERRDRVVGQDGGGAIQGDEVGRDRPVIDAHEADRQPGRLLAWKPRLVHPDDTLLLLAHAEQEDAGLPSAGGGLRLSVHVQLVDRNERDA